MRPVILANFGRLKFLSKIQGDTEAIVRSANGKSAALGLHSDAEIVQKANLWRRDVILKNCIE